MNAEDLHEEWTEGESTGLRPERIQQVRDELQEYADVWVPRRLSVIEGWLPDYKAQITRGLKEAIGEYDEEDAEGSEDE